MRYSFFILLLFSLPVIADGLTAGDVCPFGSKDVQRVGPALNSPCATASDSLICFNRTSAGSGPNSGSYWSVVRRIDCSNQPSDDTEEGGCPAYKNNSKNGYCSDDPLKECLSGGTSFKIVASKSCSDYCPSSGSGESTALVQRCSGAEGDQPGINDPGSCPIGFIESGDNCVADPDYPPSCGPGLSFDTQLGRCFKSGDDSGDDNDNGDDSGNDGDDSNPDDGSGDDSGDDSNSDDGDDSGDDNTGDPNDDNDGDGIPDNIPDNCHDAYLAKLNSCPAPNFRVVNMSIQDCRFECQQVNPGDGNNGGDDNSDGDSGGDSGNDGDNSGGDNSGGDSGDDGDDSNTGGGGDSDPNGNDPMSIDGFDSLDERITERRGEYMELLDEYRGKFSELFDFNPGSSSSPFSDNIITIMGVDINFGTSRFEPFLAFLPALILFAATCYAAFLVMSGGTK